MSNWMKRRIERSRARCGKTTTNNKSDKDRGAEQQPKLASAAPLESGAKDD